MPRVARVAYANEASAGQVLTLSPVTARLILTIVVDNGAVGAEVALRAVANELIYRAYAQAAVLAGRRTTHVDLNRAVRALETVETLTCVGVERVDAGRAVFARIRQANKQFKFNNIIRLGYSKIKPTSYLE